MTALAGWTAIHFAWQACIVWATCALFLRACPGAPATLRYRAAYGSLFALALLPIATAAALARAAASPAQAMGWNAVQPAAALAMPAAGGAAGGMPDLGAVLGSAAGVVGWAWLAVAAVLLLRTVGGVWQVRRMVRDAAAPAPAEWMPVLHAAAARLGVRRPVGVRVSTRVSVPTLVGHRAPVLLMPAGASTELSAGELACVFAHELAHVRRGDVLANTAQVVVEAMLWFHPAVRWLSARARIERECRCDADALAAAGGVLPYARALARLEGLRAAPARLALAATGASLPERVRRLAVPGPRTSLRRARAAALGAFAAAALLLTCGARLLVPSTAAALDGGAVFTVFGSDPAGPFTLSVADGRVTGATMSGRPLARTQVEQRGDSVVFLRADGRRSFAARLDARGSLSWAPRPAPNP
ncbi:MAG TPA: M56 family metallopeptidase [Longimicrobium sp.]|nr:M56 family metallopeptidase [Longimicrobium sp.]